MPNTPHPGVGSPAEPTPGTRGHRFLSEIQNRPDGTMHGDDPAFDLSAVQELAEAGRVQRTGFGPNTVVKLIDRAATPAPPERAPAPKAPRPPRKRTPGKQPTRDAPSRPRLPRDGSPARKLLLFMASQPDESITDPSGQPDPMWGYLITRRCVIRTGEGGHTIQLLPGVKERLFAPPRQNRTYAEQRAIILRALQKAGGAVDLTSSWLENLLGQTAARGRVILRRLEQEGYIQRSGLSRCRTMRLGPEGRRWLAENPASPPYTSTSLREQRIRAVLTALPADGESMPLTVAWQQKQLELRSATQCITELNTMELEGLIRRTGSGKARRVRATPAGYQWLKDHPATATP